MAGTIIIMIEGEFDFEHAWDNLITRLETLRVVGGVPAMRFELMKYDNEVLMLIKDLSLRIVTTTGVNETEQNAAFEVAASINDIIENRKGI